MLKLLPKAIKPPQLQPCTCAPTRLHPSSKHFSSSSKRLDAPTPATGISTLAERLAQRLSKAKDPASDAPAAEGGSDATPSRTLSDLIATILSPPATTPIRTGTIPIFRKPQVENRTTLPPAVFDYHPKPKTDDQSPPARTVASRLPYMAKENVKLSDLQIRRSKHLNRLQRDLPRPIPKVQPGSRPSEEAQRARVEAQQRQAARVNAAKRKALEEAEGGAAVETDVAADGSQVQPVVSRPPRRVRVPPVPKRSNRMNQARDERLARMTSGSADDTMRQMILRDWANAGEEEQKRWLDVEKASLELAQERQALILAFGNPAERRDPVSNAKLRSLKPKLSVNMRTVLRTGADKAAEVRYTRRQDMLRVEYAEMFGEKKLASALAALDQTPPKPSAPSIAEAAAPDVSSPAAPSTTPTPGPTATSPVATKRSIFVKGAKTFVPKSPVPLPPSTSSKIDDDNTLLPPLPPITSYPSILSASSIKFTPLTNPLTSPVPIARLAHGLDRVLFNPGVHFVQDPRSGVYNFPPSLQTLPKVAAFAFDKLPQYITSSKDPKLMEIAEENEKMFVSSTSSTTGMLCQIYFWLSKGKKINTSMLSSHFAEESNQFGMGQRLPASVIMNESNGRYAIDADKSFDGGIDSNILASYGHLMEKLLTTETEEFNGFLVDSPNPARSEAGDKQAYHYTMTDHLVLRSQLDAHNEHLPNVSFDVKTRGTIAIRQDRLNYVAAAGYQVDRLVGPFLSYEREYYDLIRSAFLKYSFQVRIGAMDGCFLAYHSTASFFGFQYIPITEMDTALYGDERDGEYVFNLCVGFLEKILLEAKDCYPGQSTKLTFAADTDTDVLRIFAQPTVEDPAASPMMLLELRGTNYLNGKPTREVQVFAGIPADDPYDTPAPRWDVGYRFDKYTGEEPVTNSEGTIIDTAYIAKQFSEVRDFQTMFDTLALPIGVTVEDVRKAAARAAMKDTEVTPQDLAMGLKFPTLVGVQYKNKPSKGVANLRRMAARVRSVLDKNSEKKIVRVRTVMEETE